MGLQSFSQFIGEALLLNQMRIHVISCVATLFVKRHLFSAGCWGWIATRKVVLDKFCKPLRRLDPCMCTLYTSVLVFFKQIDAKAKCDVRGPFSLPSALWANLCPGAPDSTLVVEKNCFVGILGFFNLGHVHIFCFFILLFQDELWSFPGFKKLFKERELYCLFAGT